MGWCFVFLCVVECIVELVLGVGVGYYFCWDCYGGDFCWFGVYGNYYYVFVGVVVVVFF